MSGRIVAFIFLRRRIRPSLAKNDEGLAALEFALIAPIFIVLVFGIVVYSLYVLSNFAITQAAAEGARASVAGASDDQRKTYATTAAQAVLNAYAPLLNSKNTTITPSSAGTGFYKVTVTVDRSTFGLSGLTSLLPLPSSMATASATVSNGGY